MRWISTATFTLFLLANVQARTSSRRGKDDEVLEGACDHENEQGRTSSRKETDDDEEEGGCYYENEGRTVPGGYVNVYDGNVYLCHNGQMQLLDENDLPQEEPFVANVTLPGDDDVVKVLDARCHESHSLADNAPQYLIPIMGRDSAEHVNQAVKSIKNKKSQWVCGIPGLLSLIRDDEYLTKTILDLMPEYYRDIMRDIMKDMEVEDEGQGADDDGGDRTARVIGGSNASPGQFPWHANLMLTFPWKSFCGGVLIHGCYVLTARHCAQWLQSTNSMTVVLGDTNIFTSTIGQDQYREVMYIHYHPDQDLDVALILLKSDVGHPQQSYGHPIKPIGIANFYPAPGSRAVVHGFGWTVSSSSTASPTLRYKQVTVPSIGSCQSFWSSTFPSVSPMGAHEICAGGFNPYRGACHGDSGGALIQKDNCGNYKLVGLVERGVGGCPTNMQYAIYVYPNFPAIRGWIEALLPTTDPWSPQGTSSTGKPCACLRPAVTYKGTFVNGIPFGIGAISSINNRNCLLNFVNSNMCGLTSNPNLPISLSPGGPGVASPISCWAKEASPWIEDCSRQFHYLGKAYLEQWDPPDCPLHLHPVPEGTHGYVQQSFPLYFYGYPKQSFDSDIALSATGVCFGASSMVELEHGQVVPIRDLMLGAKVKVMPHGQASEFLGWLHRDVDKWADFIDIHTEGGLAISITANHLISVLVTDQFQMIMASRVKLGDYLLTNHGPQKVWKVLKAQKRRGLYAPLTQSGTIVINGIMASCYANVEDQRLAHMSMWPVQMFPWLLESKSSQELNGIRAYPKVLKMIWEWMWDGQIAKYIGALLMPMTVII